MMSTDVERQSAALDAGHSCIPAVSVDAARFACEVAGWRDASAYRIGSTVVVERYPHRSILAAIMTVAQGGLPPFGPVSRYGC